MNFRQRMYQFMQGRYGMDYLNRVLSGIALAFIVMNLFLKSTIINTLVLAVIVYIYFRMFSRNISKRYEENVWFCNKTRPVKQFVERQKSHIQQRKTYRFYSCPKCKQKIRVPKGKGKIMIRCPKCGEEFIKRS